MPCVSGGIRYGWHTFETVSNGTCFFGPFLFVKPLANCIKLYVLEGGRDGGGYIGWLILKCVLPRSKVSVLSRMEKFIHQKSDMYRNDSPKEYDPCINQYSFCYNVLKNVGDVVEIYKFVPFVM